MIPSVLTNGASKFNVIETDKKQIATKCIEPTGSRSVFKTVRFSMKFFRQIFPFAIRKHVDTLPNGIFPKILRGF